jgi:hypothetical protein
MWYLNVNMINIAYRYRDIVLSLSAIALDISPAAPRTCVSTADQLAVQS